MIKGSTLVIAGFLIIMLGFFLIIVGSMWQVTSSDSKDVDSGGEIKTGGVIMIGPIPIIFGNDKGMVYIGVFLALILMIVSYFLFYRH
ncbi:TIGR00304 family membrane protein [Methanobacterium alcaliphilum]|uniref:TIGR00304 family membrane protein n=1 Tax=Methanobacterium alcaliphilum TaxID=392018 RepID=UPI00200A978A|nr:TIGR00304 family protein [Methanobacterium alcaliphilum]MCK9152475.1 TIGR00304 family protein [Methanobacterium alcaliphilum]